MEAVESQDHNANDYQEETKKNKGAAKVRHTARS
jgi:hypothetical protein